MMMDKYLFKQQLPTDSALIPTRNEWAVTDSVVESVRNQSEVILNTEVSDDGFSLIPLIPNVECAGMSLDSNLIFAALPGEDEIDWEGNRGPL